MRPDSTASYSCLLGGRPRRFPGSDDACADLRMEGFSAFRTATKPSPSRVSTLRPRLVAARLMATRRPCWPTVPNPGTGAMRAPVARSGARHVHRGDHRLHLPRRPRAMAHCTSQDDETQLRLHPPSRRWRKCTYSSRQGGSMQQAPRRDGHVLSTPASVPWLTWLSLPRGR